MAVAVLIAAVAMLLARGSEEPIRVYQAAATPRPVTLTPPSGWRRANAGQFSLYAFEAGQGRERARATISLSEGTPLANVNRWRGQVGLREIGQKELDQLPTLKIDEHQGYYLEVQAPPPDGTPRPGQRHEAISGAIISAKGRAWYFKLEGSLVAVDREKAAFKSFIESALPALVLAVREPAAEDTAYGN
ncbi:MAG: hypothetical protein L0Y71_17735 [Gemmataceae bacterium]|nr:hypothetical protein [Gemmataceae bacterium]